MLVISTISNHYNNNYTNNNNNNIHNNYDDDNNNNYYNSNDDDKLRWKSSNNQIKRFLQIDLNSFCRNSKSNLEGKKICEIKKKQIFFSTKTLKDWRLNKWRHLLKPPCHEVWPWLGFDIDFGLDGTFQVGHGIFLWMDGWMDGWIKEWTNGLMIECMIEWMHGWMDEWMDSYQIILQWRWRWWWWWWRWRRRRRRWWLWWW